MNKQKPSKRSVTSKRAATALVRKLIQSKLNQAQGKTVVGGQPSVLTRTGPARYGDHYFCVVLRSSTPDTKIYFYADYVAVVDGALCAYARYPRLPVTGTSYQLVLSLTGGEWYRFFAANALTGQPLSVDARPHAKPSPAKAESDESEDY